jgi:hypothetical protein
MAMTRENAIILKVAAIALLCCAWFAYWFIRQGVSVWGIVLSMVFTLFCAGIVIRGYMPGPEERSAAQLAGRGDVRSASGQVLALRRIGAAESETMRRTRVVLTVAVHAGEGPSQAELDAWIEDSLLPAFATGQTIHLLYAAGNPGLIAIDRSRSPVQIK